MTSKNQKDKKQACPDLRNQKYLTFLKTCLCVSRLDLQRSNGRYGIVYVAYLQHGYAKG